jgi:hypothetical protein
MATVTKVTESREAVLNTVTLAGRRTFLVYFDEYVANEKYSTFINLAKVAIDPNSGLKVPTQGNNFDGDVPAISDPIVSGVSVKQYEKQNTIWEVTVTFSEKTSSDSDSDKNVWQDYPWNETPSVVWGSGTLNQVIATDFDGKAIVNSAGDPFDTAITRPAALMTVTCTFNKKIGGYEPNKASRLVNTVNSGAFTIFGTNIEGEAALMKAYGGSKLKAVVNGQDIHYWQVTAAWDILVNTGSGDIGWDGVILDIGTQQRDSNGAKWTINDKFGTRLSSPQLLNGDGIRLEKATGGFNSPSSGGSLPLISSISSSKGVFLRYKQYQRSSHNSIAS